MAHVTVGATVNFSSH